MARTHPKPQAEIVQSVRLPIEVRRRLEELAGRRHRTVSGEIRAAIEAHMSNAAEAEQ